jgi:hypothetical protein
LLIALVASGCAQGRSAEPEKKDFVAAVLEAIPAPAPGEFATPEAVVRRYLESIRDHDIHECLKCFPVRATLDKHDLEFSIRQLQYYQPTFNRLQGADFLNLNLVIGRYLKHHHRTTVMLLLSDELPLDGPDVDLDTPEGKKKLKDILDRMHVRNLKCLEIGDISVEERGPESIGEFQEPLGVTALAVATAQFKHKDVEGSATCIVGKIGDNWRIVHEPQ